MVDKVTLCLYLKKYVNSEIKQKPVLTVVDHFERDWHLQVN